MALFSNAWRQLVRNNLNTIETKLAALPFWSQHRYKHHQVPFFGVKNHWPQWTMIKDQRRRMIVKDYGRFKIRLNAVRKNDILPPELQELANHEIATVPRDAAVKRMVRRCSVTSRPRGVVFRWKLSRMIFKHLSDYNKLSGIQRAMW